MGTDDRTTIRADLRGVISHWGADVQAVLGHSSEQAVGQNIELLIPGPLRPWHWRGFDKAVGSGALRRPGATAKVPALHRDGTIRAVMGEIGLTRGPSGEVIGAEVADLRPDSAWKAAAWRPVVSLVGLAGRIGLRPGSTDSKA